jgi:hypothetical protein
MPEETERFNRAVECVQDLNLDFASLLVGFLLASERQLLGVAPEAAPLKSMSELPPYIRQHEVAKLLGCDKKVVQRHAKRGSLTPIRFGRATLYARQDVLSLVELRSKKQKFYVNRY